MNALGPWSGNEPTAAAGGIVYSTYVARFFPSCCAFSRAKGGKVGSRYKCSVGEAGTTQERGGGEASKSDHHHSNAAHPSSSLPLWSIPATPARSGCLCKSVCGGGFLSVFSVGERCCQGKHRTGAQITFTEVSVWRRRRRKEINRNGLLPRSRTRRTRFAASAVKSRRRRDTCSNCGRRRRQGSV